MSSIGILDDKLIIQLSTIQKQISKPDRRNIRKKNISMCDCTGCGDVCSDDCGLTCDEECSGQNDSDICHVYFNHDSE